jgi:hypothetical protein
MIIKTFDNGWGPEFPAKKYEQEIVTKAVATPVAIPIAFATLIPTTNEIADENPFSNYNYNYQISDK